MYKNILFIFLLYTVSNAQLLKLGFRVEPTIFITEEEGALSSVRFSPYSVCFTAAINPIENLSLELRPGYLLGGEEYSGLELGAFVKWKIFSTDFYLCSGILNHYNNGTGNNRETGYDKTILYQGVGVGYQLDTKLGLDITYYWSSDAVYGYNYYIETHGSTVFHERSMKGIIKLGFSMAWNVL